MDTFDSLAKDWDKDPDNIKKNAAILSHLTSNLPLANISRILDYGCGTGELAIALLSHFQERGQKCNIVGVDSSKEMILCFAEKIKSQNLSNIESIHESDETSIPSGFDLLICNMVLHHIPTPLDLIRRFESLLNPHGFLAIIDLEKEDGSFHPPKAPGVFHAGFLHEEISEWLGYCYFKEVLHEPKMYEIAKNARTYPLTLTLAQKQN